VDTGKPCKFWKEVIYMAETLKKVECEPTCGFMIRSHDEKELIELVRQHAEKMHKMKVTDKDIREKMKTA